MRFLPPKSSFEPLQAFSLPLPVFSSQQAQDSSHMVPSSLSSSFSAFGSPALIFCSFSLPPTPLVAFSILHQLRRHRPDHAPEGSCAQMVPTSEGRAQPPLALWVLNWGTMGHFSGVFPQASSAQTWAALLVMDAVLNGPSEKEGNKLLGWEEAWRLPSAQGCCFSVPSPIRKKGKDTGPFLGDSVSCLTEQHVAG